MGVPAFRQTHGRSRKRRSHHALRTPHTVLCPNCNQARKPHQACPSCGYVRPGLQIKVAAKDT